MDLMPPPSSEQGTPAPTPGAYSIASMRVPTNITQASNQRVYGWEVVPAADPSSIPCQRSLHASAVWRNHFIVFGGYDGSHRINDLHAFNLKTNTWRQLNHENAPSPRDRHIAVVYGDSLYTFGGFDGFTRVNDLHAYNLETNQWHNIVATAGNPPSQRHSHSAVVFKDSLYIFGGYDGSYRSDLHAFHFPSGVWRQITAAGDTPRARYRGTCVVCPSSATMILHGGHDGTRHLQDTHLFDFYTQTWSLLATEGPVPSPRDSHVSVVCGNAMYLYGGSTGAAMGDFHQLKLEFRRIWSPVVIPASQNINNNANPVGFLSPGGGRNTSNISNGYFGDVRDGDVLIGEDGDAVENVTVTPGARFCHVGFAYENAFYIFGGYDGSNRLNDFLRFRFEQLETAEYRRYNNQHEHRSSHNSDYLDRGQQDKFYCANAVSSTLVSDLRQYVNSELLSDVQFVVEGEIIYAHKILCLRCPYFRNMLTGEYMESRAEQIVIPDVKRTVFLLLLEYLYTDQVYITVDTAMDLFQVADRFTIDRLKELCEEKMWSAIGVDTAAQILLTADQHHAQNLRDKCMMYILHHFDHVSVTPAFEDMGRTNVDLVFEVLRRRQKM